MLNIKRKKALGLETLFNVGTLAFKKKRYIRKEIRLLPFSTNVTEYRAVRNSYQGVKIGF